MVDQKVIVLDGTRREDDDLTSVIDVLIDELRRAGLPVRISDIRLVFGSQLSLTCPS